jgi:hypothetical protein
MMALNNYRHGEESTPRRVLIVELPDIVQRLRLGHSLKAVQRETSRHKTVIPAVRDLADREGWLSLRTELPNEEEFTRLYEETLSGRREAPSPLELYEGQIKDWLQVKYRFQVIHQLLSA